MQITFSGNLFFLCDEAEKIASQLAGQRFTLAQAGPLRDDISTDEITPVHILSHYDDRLGSYAHTGLTGQRQAAHSAGRFKKSAAQASW